MGTKSSSSKSQQAAVYKPPNIQINKSQRPAQKYIETTNLYKRILQDHLCKIVKYTNSVSNTSNQSSFGKRITFQINNFRKALPCDQTNSIFITVNQNNTSEMRAIIFGSEGTPYEHGAYLFSIKLPYDYPFKPPVVNILTTGKGKLRFNPNLYNNGYVCLSILGTWRGSSSEEWTPSSSVSKVLISIQSMVMIDQVYYNQPGYENIDKKTNQPLNRGYQNIVRYGNLAFAMNEMLEHPPEHFEVVIRSHFYLKKNKILKSIETWLEQSNLPAQYENLTKSHNPEYANLFKNQNSYRASLNSELERLMKNLSQLKLSDTAIREEHIDKSQVSKPVEQHQKVQIQSKTIQ